jgi:hypothetical protein
MYKKIAPQINLTEAPFSWDFCLPPDALTRDQEKLFFEKMQKSFLLFNVSIKPFLHFTNSKEV